MPVCETSAWSTRPPSTGPSRAAYIAAQHSRHSRAVHSCKARLQLACLGDALHACLTVSSVVGSKPVAFQLRAEHGAYPLVFRVGNFRILPLFLGGRLPNWVMTEGVGLLDRKPRPAPRRSATAAPMAPRPHPPLQGCFCPCGATAMRRCSSSPAVRRLLDVLPNYCAVARRMRSY